MKIVTYIGERTGRTRLRTSRAGAENTASHCCVQQPLPLLPYLLSLYPEAVNGKTPVVVRHLIGQKLNEARSQ